ncbi:MAG TPA: hypothetical protein ENJ87_13470 [Gammaproteobacteria bacterium]|nr:hypothetical protein [Gammaproteobacteria bacterium]
MISMNVVRRYVMVAFLSLVSENVIAGTYLFASEVNGVDLVTHPNTYTGTENIVTVRVCIAPTSPNAAQMEYAVQNNIAAYNQLLPTTGNVRLGTNNNVPANAIDFESVALHELGHCLGMAHVNAASESGQTGNNQNYTRATDGVDNILNLNPGADGVIGSSDDIRGDDDNLFWFRRTNNDPFTIDAVVDSTTYSRNLADLPAGHTFAANPDRAVSTLLGHPLTEAAMQQGTFFDEAQRTLGHDDVATLRYAESGINELENDPGNPNVTDNYSIVLEYGGISTTNCDVSMSFTATTGLAFCGVGGAGIAPGHVRITTASIEFGQAFNWFFNAPNSAPVLNMIGDLNLTEAGNLQVALTATDVDINTLSFSVTGLPAFASFVDNGDGTATLTLAPVLGDAASYPMTVTVSDNGEPVLTANENFTVSVAALDSDGDGLSDFDEINIYGTLPDNPDTDGDFINDGIEVSNGGNPLDPLVWPNLADGDIAPLGAPDGLINAADYLLAQRIVLGDLTATSLELAHSDLYPVAAPDGVIDISDLILLLPLVQQ